MRNAYRWAAVALATGMALTLFPGTRAHASSEERRNTAWAMTAAAGYLAYKYAQKPSSGRFVPAVAAAGAAGWAWHKYGTTRRAERERQRAAWINYGRRTAYRRNAWRTDGYRGRWNRHYSRRAHRHRSYC